MSFQSIIDRWSSCGALARALQDAGHKISAGAVVKWRRLDAIPVKWWGPVAAVGKFSTEELAAIAALRATAVNKRAARRSAGRAV